MQHVQDYRRQNGFVYDAVSIETVYYDEYTGKALPEKWVRAAMAEEMDLF